MFVRIHEERASVWRSPGKHGQLLASRPEHRAAWMRGAEWPGQQQRPDGAWDPYRLFTTSGCHGALIEGAPGRRFT